MACRAVDRVLSVLLLSATAAGGRPRGPCDIYAAARSPCVAAHSVARALYAAYDGPLYLVNRSSDNATMEVGVDPLTGFASAGKLRAFCPSAKRCTVERIFDQSPLGNHLDRVPMNYKRGWPVSGIDPMKDQFTLGGSGPLYSAYFEGLQTPPPHNRTPMGVGTIGFRALHTKGVARGDAPESMYAVVSGTHYNSGCCFDYGNAEGNPGEGIPNPKCGEGKMEAISFGNTKVGGGAWSAGAGDGPWVMADLEMGVWAGNKRGQRANKTAGTPAVPAVNPRNAAINATFVTAVLKGRPGGWALKHGDAQKGHLTTLFDGPRPSPDPRDPACTSGYDPMVKQGAIVLGIGGDTSDNGVGTFYEGAMTVNYTTDATDEAVQANIVAAGYAV